MKKIKTLICLLALGSLNSPSWAADKNQWHISTVQGKTNFSGEGEFIEHSKAQVLSLSKDGDISTVQGLLSRYYWLLKQQDSKAAAMLFSDKEGSRTRFRKALVSKKLRLKQYQQLQQVSIQSERHWDDFNFVSLKLKASSGRAMSWQETVACDKQCYLLFNPLKIDEVSQLLDVSYMTYLESNRVYGDVSGKIKYQKRPLKVTVSHPDSSLFVGRKLPLNYRLDINRYKKAPIISRGKTCDSYSSNEEQAFCQLFNQVDAIDVADSAKLDSFIKDLTGKPDAQGLDINLRIKGRIEKRFFATHAFVTMARRWQKVRLVGSFENESTRFVLFKPTLDDQHTLPLQVVTFAKDNKASAAKLIYGSNWQDTYLFFYNGLFVNALNKEIATW